MTNLNARKRAIGIITGGRVDALEGAGLVVVERAEIEALEAERDGYIDKISYLVEEAENTERKIKAVEAENERLKEAEKQRLTDPCGHCACTEICEDKNKELRAERDAAIKEASDLVRALMRDEDEDVNPCEWCCTPIEDNCEGCSRYTENENDECRFRLGVVKRGLGVKGDV